MSRGAEELESIITAWPGVVAVPHRFGGREFRFGRRELGHLHGSSVLDLPFPLHIRNELVEQGRADSHHVLPESGWVTFHIRRPDDVARAIALLRLNYDRPWTMRSDLTDPVGEASEESFPASDSPAFVAVTGITPRKL
jgi:hypothetical protein